MGVLITTFPHRDESEKASAQLEALSLPYELVSPEPGYGFVAAPALAMPEDARMRLAAEGTSSFVCSGWVAHRPATIEVPGEQARGFDQDVFGEARVMVLASCVADQTRIRIVAHISGDLTNVFPYLNAEMKQACYNRHGPTFTFMDGYRMVSVYARRIAVAKADEIVDAWRVLAMVRCRANDAWARRAEIEPSYEVRKRPPALELYKRLPRINCGECGEATCLAFAVRVHAGELIPTRCIPVFMGEYADLKDALLEICSGLGIDSSGMQGGAT
ncbi:MAG: (Fe-S)-binding protein [Planctomycetota bacterium]|jgi:ArsR family metal-binding transcriptional regulator